MGVTISRESTGVLARMRLASIRHGWLLELSVILVWVLYVTRPYLDLHIHMTPIGREYLHHIHPHFLWLWMTECGQCAFWHGGVGGGYPTFVDPLSSHLHPLIIVTTLVWGVLNGSKIALIGAFLMAGAGQWWLGRVLNLGWIARLWGACMIVVSGHLAARQQHGFFSLMIAIAATHLVLPPLIRLHQTGQWRPAVVLGITLSLLLVAGQGYIQIGYFLLLPTALILVRWSWPRARQLLSQWFLVATLTSLLAAPFLVPLLHFLPEFVKLTEDTSFATAQPLQFIPLNLVISDHTFYASYEPSKVHFPSLYIIYVGWVPVLLALYGLLGLPQRCCYRTLIMLFVMILLSFWLASATPLRWFAALCPFPACTTFVAGIRFPSLFSMLAVSPLIGLACVGLQRLVDRLGSFRSSSFVFSWHTWPYRSGSVQVSSFTLNGHPWSLGIDLRWLLSIPLIWSLWSGLTFVSPYIATVRLSPVLFSVIDALHTQETQWVATPFGEQAWITPALQYGLKLHQGTQVWFWRDRKLPLPYRIASQSNIPPGASSSTLIAGIIIGTFPTNQYAAVYHTDGSHTPCKARGRGGHITVVCQTTQAGDLVVQENAWDGWYAWLNPSTPLQLQRDSPWLRVSIPPGNHTITFQYRPWDVPLGLVCCGAGIILSVIAWWRAEKFSAVNKDNANA